jgi:hypothetical protein
MTRGSPIPDTVTLHVPFHVVKRGGRKEMQLPEGATQSHRTDSTLVKALARAFRWKRMLESGEFATIAELADREGIAPSYMTRVLRLTLLAPDIVETILDGTQGPEVTLTRVLESFPVVWSEQPTHFTPEDGSGSLIAVMSRAWFCCPPGSWFSPKSSSAAS